MKASSIFIDHVCMKMYECIKASTLCRIIHIIVNQSALAVPCQQNSIIIIIRWVECPMDTYWQGISVSGGLQLSSLDLMLLLAFFIKVGHEMPSLASQQAPHDLLIAALYPSTKYWMKNPSLLSVSTSLSFACSAHSCLFIGVSSRSPHSKTQAINP